MPEPKLLRPPSANSEHLPAQDRAARNQSNGLRHFGMGHRLSLSRLYLGQRYKAKLKPGSRISIFTVIRGDRHFRTKRTENQFASVRFLNAIQVDATGHDSPAERCGRPPRSRHGIEIEQPVFWRSRHRMNGIEDSSKQQRFPSKPPPEQSPGTASSHRVPRTARSGPAPRLSLSGRLDKAESSSLRRSGAASGRKGCRVAPATRQLLIPALSCRPGGSASACTRRNIAGA